MTTTIIGLMGRAGAGKDTAADYMLRRHDFNPYALATPIKGMLEALLCLVDADHAHLYEPGMKQQPIPQLDGRCARQLMTSLGDWGRGLDEHFWLRAAERALGLHKGASAAKIVISDVRYPNEAGWVRKLGGRIWLIQRDNLPTVATHPSEYSHHQVVPDVTITNNLSREALYFAIDQELTRLQLQQALKHCCQQGQEVAP